MSTPARSVTAPAVAVVGVGAVGAVFAAALQEARRAPVLCVRVRRSLAVEDPAGRMTELTAPMVASPAEVRGPADWVLLAVKAHQTAGAAAWLRKLAGPETTVLVLQNGVDQADRVAPFAGPATVLPTVIWCPAEPAGPGAGSPACLGADAGRRRKRRAPGGGAAGGWPGVGGSDR
jgi:2-dehydropantoate 2-reductase